MNQFKRMMMVSLSISAFFISASTHTYAYNDDVKMKKRLLNQNILTQKPSLIINHSKIQK